MTKFTHSIANKYERFVFSSTDRKDPTNGKDLVQVVSYSMHPGSKFKPAVSHLPIDFARDYYRRLMGCGMGYKPVTLTNIK
tara:strand:- start:1591 stop:1833 length:243 start_codon:yes stop_codon:yes gene_type:complete